MPPGFFEVATLANQHRTVVQRMHTYDQNARAALNSLRFYRDREISVGVSLNYDRFKFAMRCRFHAKRDLAALRAANA